LVSRERCPQCGAVDRAGAAFCQRCGTQLPVPSRCPNWGAAIGPDVKFCKSCGAGLGATAEADVAAGLSALRRKRLELKTRTVTNLTEPLGREEAEVYWPPDWRTIAFSAKPAQGGRFELYTVDVGARKINRVTGCWTRRSLRRSWGRGRDQDDP
jgi:hypothetical protein